MGKKRIRRKRSIEIAGVKVKIKYTKDMLIDGEHELHGSFNPDTMTIHVSINEQTHSTLCHEVFHAFLHISGYSQGMPAKTEEGLTTSFEHAMARYFNFS